MALIRGKVFVALRKLCPAKLEGREKGDFISVITSDIELLEVFYAHTISPAAKGKIVGIVGKLMLLDKPTSSLDSLNEPSKPKSSANERSMSFCG